MAATMTLTQIARALMVNIKLDIPTLVVGPVGVGKTDVVRQCADKLRAQGKKVLVIDKRASQMEPTDLAVPMPDVATRMVITCLQEWLPDAIRGAAYDVIILLFDELSDAQPSVQAALNQLILERELPGYKLPANVRIVATGNRQEDRGNAQKFNRATSNRMAVFVAGIDVQSWINWANGAGISPELIAYVDNARRLLIGGGKPEAEALHKYPSQGSDAQAFKTSRSVARCDKYLKEGLNDVDLHMMLAGNVGEECADDIMLFLATYRLLPDLNAILADPLNAKIHREPGTNFALMVALVSRLTLANIATITTYVNRLSPGYREAFWSNALAKDDTFRETAEFVAHKINS